MSICRHPHICRNAMTAGVVALALGACSSSQHSAKPVVTSAPASPAASATTSTAAPASTHDQHDRRHTHDQHDRRHTHDQHDRRHTEADPSAAEFSDAAGSVPLHLPGRSSTFCPRRTKR